MEMAHCALKTAYKALGGSYREVTDYQHQLNRYRAEKRKETELKRIQRERQEREEVIKEIKLQKLFKKLSPVFSDDWCEAVNRLEYLFYRLAILTEKR